MLLKIRRKVRQLASGIDQLGNPSLPDKHVQFDMVIFQRCNDSDLGKVLDEMQCLEPAIRFAAGAWKIGCWQSGSSAKDGKNDQLSCPNDKFSQEDFVNS